MNCNNYPVEPKCTQSFVDAHGDPVQVFEDVISRTQYINLEDAKNCGYQVFASPEAAMSYMQAELREYLNSQFELYLKVKGLTGHKIAKATIEVELNEREIQNNSIQSHVTNSCRQSESFGSVVPNLEFVRDSLESTKESEDSKLMPEIRSKSTAASTRKLTKLKMYPQGDTFIQKLAGQQPTVHILRKLSPTTFIAYILTARTLDFDDIMSSVNIEKELNNVTPGDYAIVKADNEKISRAFVLELTNGKFRVAMIDYAEVVEVSKVYQVPKELEKFEEFTCICEAAASYVHDLNVDDLKIMTCTENYNLRDNASKVEIKCERWVPEEFRGNNLGSVIEHVKKPEQVIYMVLPTDEIPVSLNTLVAVMGFEDGLLYLRSKEMYIILINMNKQIQEVVPLDSPPKIRQYVLHKTHKSEWRRCIVKKVIDNKVHIEYIDYLQPNTIVRTNEIFNLTPAAVFGPTLIKRRLRSFQDKIYSDKVVQKLTALTQQKFFVTYQDCDVIDMKKDMNDKKSLSELLKELDAPPPKTIADLPSISLEYNQKLEIVILYDDKDNSFAFAPVCVSSNILTKVSDLEYLKDAPKEENITVGQLCVALFEGDWFRGEVKEVHENTVKVYFVDFGNTDMVAMDFIKALPDDMVSIAACALTGIKTSDSPHSSKITAGEMYVAIIKKKDGNKHHVQLLELLE